MIAPSRLAIMSGSAICTSQWFDRMLAPRILSNASSLICDIEP
jgi:hypothetical protein